MISLMENYTKTLSNYLIKIFLYELKFNEGIAKVSSYTLIVVGYNKCYLETSCKLVLKKLVS